MPMQSADTLSLIFLSADYKKIIGKNLFEKDNNNQFLVSFSSHDLNSI